MGCFEPLSQPLLLFGLIDQSRRFDNHRGIRRYRIGQPDISADDRTCSDNGFASEDGCAGIDDDIILNGGMAFPASEFVTGSFGDGQSAQRDSLVNSDVVPDFGGFADHHPGSMVNDETFSDFGGRVNIDTGNAVSIFGHNPRQQRHAEIHQLMGNSINGDGKYTRIAEDDLIIAPGGRVAMVGGPHIVRQRFAEGGNGFQKLQGQLITLFFTLAAGLIISQTVMPDAATDLLGKHVKQSRGRLAHRIFQVHRINLAPAEISREQNFSDTV